MAVPQVVTSSTAFIRCMCVSPGGRWACAGLSSGALVLLDLRTGTPRAVWKAHDGEVSLITYT